MIDIWTTKAEQKLANTDTEWEHFEIATIL